MYEKVWLNDENGVRLCGQIVDDTYISRRIAKIHFYIKGGGYPITNSILKELKEKNVKYVIIEEEGKEHFRKYKTTLDKYLNAVLIQEPRFEQQRCVPLKEMELIFEKSYKQEPQKGLQKWV